MPVNNDVLALILGGGQGTRLFPLTQHRSKPAVPIGGQYRLIDIPDQQLPACGHPADLRAHAVQFGVAQPAHLAVLPDGSLQPGVRRNPRGRADARQPELVSGHGRRRAPGGAAFRPLRRRLLPDSRRRSPVPHGLRRTRRRAHRSPRRHHHCRAAGRRSTTRPAWVSSGSTATARSSPSKRSPRATRLDEIGQSIPPDRSLRGTRRTSRSSRRWASTCFRATCCSICWRASTAKDFGREVIPAALGRYRVQRPPVPRLLGRRRHRSSRSTTPTSCSRSRGAPFKFYDPHRPIYTHPRFLPGRAFSDCAVATRSSPRAAISTAARSRNRSSASARTIQAGATIRRSVLLGADFYEADGDCRRAVTVHGSASAATSCWIASSSTRTPGSATARAWSTKRRREADGDGTTSATA